MNEVEISLVATEARTACEGESDLTERGRKAMRAARDHWMVLDPDLQLRGALVAAVDASQGDERTRLERSIELLGQVSTAIAASQSGVPVDWEEMLNQQKAMEDEDFEPLPIIKLWHETDPALAAG